MMGKLNILMHIKIKNERRQKEYHIARQRTLVGGSASESKSAKRAYTCTRNIQPIQYLSFSLSEY
jgi:hypothetical protein